MTPGHKLRLAILSLAVLHALILFAGFVAPYDFSSQNRDLTFAPPAQIHFVDAQGKIHARPFVYGLKTGALDPTSYEIDPSQIRPLEFFVTGTPYKIAGVIPVARHLFGVRAPSQIFLMVTDIYARDQFSRFLSGGQISL